MFNPPRFQVFRCLLGYVLPIEQPSIIAWHSATLNPPGEARSTRSFGAEQNGPVQFVSQSLYMPVVGLLDLPGAEVIAFKLRFSGRETPFDQIAHSALRPLGGVLVVWPGDLSQCLIRSCFA